MTTDIEKQKNHESESSSFRSLGMSSTIGDLRKAIEKYPDDTSFGFRNQPMQELFEINNSKQTFVLFDEPKNDFITEKKSVCPECGYPIFKRSFEDFYRCHGCDWTSNDE
jgi:ribosomal protein S27AE